MAVRASAALDAARSTHAAGGKLPGFGHPLHRPVDPRAERILELAGERGVAGPHVELALQLREAVHAVWARPLPMNGRAMIRPTLFSPRISSRAIAQIRHSSSTGITSSCAAT